HAYMQRVRKRGSQPRQASRRATELEHRHAALFDRPVTQIAQISLQSGELRIRLACEAIDAEGFAISSNPARACLKKRPVLVEVRCGEWRVPGGQCGTRCVDIGKAQFG